MNRPSTRVYGYTSDATTVIASILGTTNVSMPIATNCTSTDIYECLDRRELRLIFRHLYKHNLYVRQKYKVLDRTYREITFYSYKMQEHFGINVQPVHSRHYRNYYKYISDRLFNEIKSFTSDFHMEYGTRRYILNTLRKLNDLEHFQGHDRHFDLTTDGRLTYTPANKITILSENNKWLATHRQEIKYGKGLRKILSPISKLLSDQFYEGFHNFINSKYHFSDTFKIVSGDDIKKYYHQRTYASGSGSLNGSCMKYDECQDYLDIYSDNPETCSMLISLNHNNLVTGRALLWKTRINDNSVTAMDRIYGNDITTKAFIDYASNNGFIYKKYQNYHDNTFVLPNGSTYNSITIQLQNIPSSYSFPYMDTFKYLNTSNNILSTYIACADLKLEDTHGGYEELNDYHVYLHDGTRVHEDDAGFCEYEDEYYHIDDCTWSHIESSYIPNDRRIYVRREDDYVHENNDSYAQPHDATEYFHVDDLRWSKQDDCYYYEDYVECPIRGVVGTENTILITLHNNDIEPVFDGVTATELTEHYKSIYNEDELAKIIELNPNHF